MAILAVGASCEVFSGISSEHVHFVGHWFQMGWIAATANAAKVIKFKPATDRTDEGFVGHAMRTAVVAILAEMWAISTIAFIAKPAYP